MRASAQGIAVEDLLPRIGRADAPVIVDVRRAEDFAAEPMMLPGSFRGAPDQYGKWALGLTPGAELVVTCVHGRQVSQSVAEALRLAGFEARFLEGGLHGWREQGGAIVAKPLAASPVGPHSAWVTRERPKVDRVACPWLVRRFLDPRAAFLYVPVEAVDRIAADSGALPYDTAGAELGHVGELCSFDAFIRRYEIADAALGRLATVVRGADTGRPELTPQSPGLLALSYGLSRLCEEDDHGMLDRAMVVYDALYAWCRGEIAAGRP